MNLDEALINARAMYPNKPSTFPLTTLCVTNRFRKTVNASYNEAEYRKSHKQDGVFIQYKCSEKTKANQCIFGQV